MSKRLIGHEQAIINGYLVDKKGIINLAREYITSEAAIKQLLMKHKVPIRNKKEARAVSAELHSHKARKIQDQSVIDKIVEQYYSGMGCAELGELYNRPSISMRLILKREGVKFRNVKEAQSHPHTKARLKQKTVDKYGVSSAMHVPELFTKQNKNRYKFKTATINGILFENLQGYEELGIRRLIDTHKIDVSDIVAGRAEDIPRVWYHDDKGVRRMYYPDIFVPKRNLLVEVKSVFTFANSYSMSFAKQAASKAAGFDHIMIIFNNKQQFVEEI
jgi:hypothetical protein